MTCSRQSQQRIKPRYGLLLLLFLGFVVISPGAGPRGMAWAQTGSSDDTLENLGEPTEASDNLSDTSTEETLLGDIVLFEEDFEGTFRNGYNGWSVGDSEPLSGYAYWDDVSSSFGGEGAYHGSNKAYAAGNSSTSYCGSTSNPSYRQYMVSYMERTVDLTPMNTARLSFQYKLPSLARDVYLLISTSGSTRKIRFTDPVTSWTEKTIDLTESVGQEITLKWVFDNDWSDDCPSDGEAMYVDYIRVTGSPASDPVAGRITSVSDSPDPVDAGSQIGITVRAENTGIVTWEKWRVNVNIYEQYTTSPVLASPQKIDTSNVASGNDDSTTLYFDVPLSWEDGYQYEVSVDAYYDGLWQRVDYDSWYYFDVNSMTTLSLDDHALDPAHPRVVEGESFTVRYYINNPTSTDKTIYLIARSRTPDGAYYLLENTSGQTAVQQTISPGANWYRRNAVVYSGAPVADGYSLTWFISETSSWSDWIDSAEATNAFDVIDLANNVTIYVNDKQIDEWVSDSYVRIFSSGWSEVVAEGVTAPGPSYQMEPVPQLSDGIYPYEIFNHQAADGTREYWGTGSITVDGATAATLPRNAPFVDWVQPLDANGQNKIDPVCPGEPLTIRVTIDSRDEAVSSRQTRTTLYINPDQSLTNPVGVQEYDVPSGSSGTHDFYFNYQVPADASVGDTYYINPQVEGWYNEHYEYTDRENWVWDFQIGDCRTRDAGVFVSPRNGHSEVGTIDAADIAEIVQNIADHGMDKLYVSVFESTASQQGDLMIIDEAGTWDSAWGETRGYVTLSELIDAAHAQGIQVIGSVSAFPEGTGLSPDDEDHRTYLAHTVLNYLVHSYDEQGLPYYGLDGIALDMIRYTDEGGNHESTHVTATTALAKSVIGELPLYGFMLVIGCASPDGAPCEHNGSALGHAIFYYGQDWNELADPMDYLLPMVYLNEELWSEYPDQEQKQKNYMTGAVDEIQASAGEGAQEHARVLGSVQAFFVPEGQEGGPQTPSDVTVVRSANSALNAGAGGFFVFEYYKDLDDYPTWWSILEAHSEPNPDFPQASFEVTGDSQGLSVSVDASASSDNATASSVLQVRWDWENDGDGVWDTAPSTVKTASHTYASPGPRVIALQVKDGDGLTDVTLRRIEVSGPDMIIDDVTVDEGDTGTVDAVFTVSLSAAIAQEVTVEYATADGSATAGSDYLADNGTLTFPAGSITQNISIVVNGDLLVEPDETFVVQLSNATNAAIADGQGVGRINDDDPPPSLSVDDVTVVEGDTGTVDAVFTVSLSAASGQQVTVDYATANDTATAGSDYVANSGRLTFPAETATENVTVVVNGDTLDEPNESYFVNLSGATNATIADGQGVGTIADDDGVPSLSVDDVTVLEGDTGMVDAVFIVSLSAAIAQEVTVDYATANDTATAGSDYVADNGTLIFPAGSTTQSITVVVNGDAVAEPHEAFVVQLSNAINATIADGQGVGTITDDDAEIPDGLVAHYPFNSNANDESGNGNDGVVNGATLTTDRAGNANGAYSFDGIDDHISIPANSVLADMLTGTITLWFKPSSDWDSSSPVQGLMSNDTGGYNNDFQIGFNAVDNDNRNVYTGKIYLHLQGSGSLQHLGTTTTSWSSEDWHLLAFTWNGSQAEVFVNGVSEGTQPFSSRVFTSYLPTYIGVTGKTWDPQARYFSGSMDDVRVYNRALTEEEILALSNEPPIAWYVATTGDDSNDCQSPATACQTIQAAIDKASGGATIYVSEGSYNENVVLMDNITLLGTGPGLSTISGHDSVITGADGATVAGFTISNDGSGLSWGYSSGLQNSESMTFRNNVFTGHYVGVHAGDSGEILNIINNVFAGNDTAISLGWANAPTIRNNIVVDNGVGIHYYTGGTPDPQADIDYNDVWGNTNYDYSPEVQPGPNDISVDPQFVDVSASDYHLQPCSSAIDTGDPASDYSNEPEPNGGRINMGAYGNTTEATSYNCPTAITGHVYEEDGTTPVENACVNVSRTAPAWDQVAGFCCTDADGAFTITGLPAGDFYVKTHADCQSARPNLIDEWYAEGGSTPDGNQATPVVVVEGQITPGIDFALDRAGSISGHVYQADGVTPIPDAWVYALDADFQTVAGSHSQADGTYEIHGLVSGSYYLAVDAAGFGGVYYDDGYDDPHATPVSVVAPDNTPNIDFHLSPEATISGHVYQSDGTTPIAGATVEVWPQQGGQIRDTITNADGSYTVGGLSTGYYVAQAEASDHATEFYADAADWGTATPIWVEQPGDSSGIDFTLDIAGSISGHVFKADGVTVITDTVISVHAHGITPGSSSLGTYVSQSDGSYTISNLAPGTYKVQANNNLEPGYVTKYYDDKLTWDEAGTVEVVADGETAGVDFVLEEAGVASGRVYEEDGTTPVADACVNVSSTAPEWNQVLGWCCTDADGDFSIGSLLTGSYYLRTHADCQGAHPNLLDEWYADSGSTPDGDQATPVEVLAGQTASGIEFALDHVGTVSGIVHNADGSSPISHAAVGFGPADNQGSYTTYCTDEEGRFSIPVPFGSYKVFARGSTHCGSDPNYVREYWQEKLYWDEADIITLTEESPSATDITFTLELGGSIWGTVYDVSDSSPIGSMCVNARSVDGSLSSFVTSEDDGTYTIPGLPLGEYKVHAHSGCGADPSYVAEYWQEKDSWDEADVVTVSVGQREARDIDFTLGRDTARLYLDSSSTSVTVNQIFTVDISFDTGAATADTVDAYINFEPGYLEVVDASGLPVSTIELNADVFSNATFNSVDNATGQINFSASRYDTPLEGGPFRAATIRFKAKAEVDSTPLTIVRAGARWSDLLLAGETINPTMTDGTVSIASTIVLQGRVALERRGDPGDPRWITELYRMVGDTKTGGITVYEAGTDTVLGTFSATTDQNGHFSVELAGIDPGTYDMTVKGANTLSNKKSGVTLPSDADLDFGTLLVGDSNGNDAVNGGDVSYMIPSFLKCSGDAEFRPYGDTNSNGCINGADVSALIPNFLQAGPVSVSGSALQAPTATLQSLHVSGGESLSLAPVTQTVQAGDIFTVDIAADTGTSTADTVDAYIDFDPTYLEVVDGTGKPASSIEVNTEVFSSATFNSVDNATGQINFSASKYESPYLTNSFTAATIRFRVKATVATTDVTFVRDGARMSDLYQSGEPLNATLTNSTVTSSLKAKAYLPLIRTERGRNDAR